MYDWFAGHLGQIGIGPRARVVVGYSGGPDSTCLLHLCTRAGLDVVAAHLHHGQRLEADGEAEQCATFASQLSVPFVLGNADVPVVARTQRIGLDEAGRRARYSFLETTKLQTAAQWILTAHTLDDHVETVLMRIARGTGLTGPNVFRRLCAGPVDERRAWHGRHCSYRTVYDRPDRADGTDDV
ncbi:MAG: tRNA lysidine(34) synthetase TilS, partial [Chthonomonadaceae bacterium]|nr:tRNA lysidine(34) synthetase TilS [Chthonomonadaceae bacterium]